MDMQGPDSLRETRKFFLRAANGAGDDRQKPMAVRPLIIFNRHVFSIRNLCILCAF